VNGLGIEAVGAFTAVGKNGAETMGSLMSRVQLFGDLDVAGGDGEPIAGAITPIPRHVTGTERLLALALYAIEDCLKAAPGANRRLPLILVVPAPPDLADGQAATLLGRLESEGGLPLDLATSQVIARGREGVALALVEAVKLIRSRATPACLVAGVDSFVDPARVRRLMAAGRVREAASLDGFTPGEAAACLLLTSEGVADSGAVLAGFGLAEEPGSWTGEPPVTGQGLGRAIAAAIADAGVSAADLAYIAHDVSGEHAAFDELSLALGRLPPREADQVEVWGPASCTGEIGAAAGFVSLAMLAFYIKKGVLTRVALAPFVSEGRIRGAAVVAPAPAERR
jgi:3-oxoacyl-[acyl-carrier-protein] synthase-1